MRLSIRRTDAVLMLAAALVVGLYVLMAGGGFPLDDSWIHQTYGRNLGTLGQFAFVPGVPSAASTSPLYTVLLAIGYALGVPYALWTHTLGVLALGGAGIIAARMAERLTDGRRGVGLAAGLAVVLAWHLVWAAASGMETMLFGAFTLALMALAWRELDAQSPAARNVLLRGAAFGALAGVTMLTRPEGIVLAGLIGVFMFFTNPFGSIRAFFLWGVGAAVAFTVITAPYFAYNLSVTGGLLPDTAAAKQAEFASLLAAPYLTRIWAMLVPLAPGVQVLLLPGAVAFAALVVRKRERGWLLQLMPVVWALALVMLYAARLPAAYQYGRYVMPTLPGFMVAGVVGTAWLLRAARGSRVGRVAGTTLAASAGVTCLLFALLIGPTIYSRDVRIINEEMVTGAKWIAANVPTDALLAAHDIGAIGYFANRPILDTAGLVSPEVVPVMVDAAGLWALMEARGVAYMMALPYQLPGQRTDDPRLCPLFATDGATARGMDMPNMVVYQLAWSGGCNTD